MVIPLNASAPIHLSPPHKYPLNPQINNLLKNILKVFVDFCGELCNFTPNIIKEVESCSF